MGSNQAYPWDSSCRSQAAWDAHIDKVQFLRVLQHLVPTRIEESPLDLGSIVGWAYAASRLSNASVVLSLEIAASSSRQLLWVQSVIFTL